MKRAEFIELFSYVTGVSQQTVALFVRNLKEGGLLTSGARGVNAPHMTANDAARTLIAIVGTEKPKDAVPTVLRYKNAQYTLPPDEDPNTFEKEAREELSLSVGCKLEEFFEEKFLSAENHWMFGFSINLQARFAEIESMAGSVSFSANFSDEDHEEVMARSGIGIIRHIGPMEILALFNAFIKDRIEVEGGNR